ncbi:MAG: hypothetical protein OSB43_06595 [Nocardioides sp.]|uniref:hypothetical protein n=1 Tax=Nocardioides sp. TaxID=35761 RepID=UPI0023940BB2|nr:hypothetical protein [Nocardioides sp.]MDE0775921.1 hypothetical protein [Nocardioides sp.]
MARKGIASVGDIIKLADGTDPNTIWAEFASTLAEANAKRGALVDLLAFRTTRASDTVLQAPAGTAEFEDASEYGVPTGARAEAATIDLGYPLVWKDLGTKFTWRYLAEASAAQVESLHNAALAADSRLQYKTVLNALFNDQNRTHSSTEATIHALWNGDGSEVPDYNGDTFDPSHTHYTTTESATLAPADVEFLQGQVLEHGYGEDDGSQLVILCNRNEADVIAGWRAGAGGAKFDFISSDTSVPYLTTEQLVGQRPAGNVAGLKVSGQYGHALIAPTSLIPVGYLACVAVGGATPVIGLREHSNPSTTGLVVIPGNRQDYPLIGSWYTHAVGAGVRQRGGAAVLQVTASPTYTAPSFT